MGFIITVGSGCRVDTQYTRRPEAQTTRFQLRVDPCSRGSLLARSALS